jgi:hypothetical protein
MVSFPQVCQPNAARISPVPRRFPMPLAVTCSLILSLKKIIILHVLTCNFLVNKWEGTIAGKRSIQSALNFFMSTIIVSIVFVKYWIFETFWRICYSVYVAILSFILFMGYKHVHLVLSGLTSTSNHFTANR